MEIKLSRVNSSVHLRAHNDDGNTVEIDGAPAIGGERAGFRPMQLVLAAIAGCASMDLIPILAKQRQRLDDLAITVRGERADALPAPFVAIDLHFDLYGEIDEKQAARAVDLAVHKYCSVGEMLKATAKVTATYAIHATGGSRGAHDSRGGGGSHE